MKKYIVLTFALLGSVISNVSAQIIDVVDDFSDGDFVSSPSWKGDTADFMVYDLQLRLNGSKADTSYLSIRPNPNRGIPDRTCGRKSRSIAPISDGSPTSPRV